jgi:hypothetical protein
MGSNDHEPDMTPCATCGRPTPMWGTWPKRCERCWELERHLDDYLTAGGAKAQAFVLAALKKHRGRV